MAANDRQPRRKRMEYETKLLSTDPINLAIAQEVLRRVREGELPDPRQENNPIAD